MQRGGKKNSKQSKLQSILFSVDEKNNLKLCLDSIFFFNVQSKTHKGI